MNTLKRQGSYKTQYKLVSGFLRGDKYTALTANTLLDTTRLTNNVIQCERDGLEIVHIEIPNEGFQSPLGFFEFRDMLGHVDFEMSFNPHWGSSNWALTKYKMRRYLFQIGRAHV